jgi:DNA mismatch repair protein MutL
MEEQLGSSLQRSNLQNWEKLFEEERPTQSRLFTPTPDVQSLRMESLVNSEPVSAPSSDEKLVFQFQQRFLVRPVKNGLMIIDQQSAHERILYERFLAKMDKHSGTSLQSLFPQTVTLSAADFALVMEMEREITALGFQFEVFGKNTLVVNGMPAEAAGKNEKELFEGLVEQFKQNQSSLSLPLADNLARALSKRASIKAGQKLSREEMGSLVEGLLSCRNPNYSPEGNTTFFILETSKIENYFN